MTTLTRNPSTCLLLWLALGCNAAVHAAPNKADAARAQVSRESMVLETGSIVGAKNRQPKAGPYNVIAAARQGDCAPEGGAELMAGLPYPPMAGPDSGIEMFSLPPLVRYLYEFGDCMKPELKKRLLQGLTQRQQINGHGTLNHAAMYMTSWYLLAQYFPDARWTDWDGKTYSSAEVMATMKSKMARRNWRFFESGHAEMFSPTYAIVNLFPYLNLFDFAKDPEVKAIANAEATLEVVTLQAQSFQGTVLPPVVRQNSDQRNQPVHATNYKSAVSQHILWYYFGRPQTDDYDLSRGGEPMYAALLAMSKWRPPQVAIDWQNQPGGYEIRTNTPEFSTLDAESWIAVYGSSYIGPRFALGAGNGVFNPAGYHKDNQFWGLVFESDAARNQISCYHPYWRSNDGEDAWNTDRWSPFQQIYRYDEGSAVVLYDIPDKDPWVYGKDNRFFGDRANRKDALYKVVNCRVPRSVDEVVTEDQWVFARKGKVFMALGTLNGKNEYAKTSMSGPLADYLSFKVRESRTALYVRAVDASDKGSFADFIKETKRLKPDFDEKTSSASWRTRSGTAVKMQFALRPDVRPDLMASLPDVTLDGKLQPRPPAQPVIQAPGLTLSGGTLSATVGSSKLSLRAPRRD